jgi:hypothetical protein
LKPSSKKKGKKGKKIKMDDMFDDMGDDDFEMPSSKRGSRNSPVGTYQSAYQHNKPVPYESAYAGKNVMSGQHKEAYVGRGMSNEVYKSPGNPRTYEQAPPRPPTPQPMRARAPVIMPTVGSFGRGNIKMPTISIGGSMRNTSAHKMGPSNMPSINIPTLGSSTLMMGSGLMKKTANNLTIMGAGKGAVKFGIGEIPRFGLAAPVKRKK